jgi:hypothetical protein
MLEVCLQCRKSWWPSPDWCLQTQKYFTFNIYNTRRFIRCAGNMGNLMFCWPCIVTYQYSKPTRCTFCLLWISSLYMFRALLARLQEALHKQLVYCVRVMSIGCYQPW